MSKAFNVLLAIASIREYVQEKEQELNAYREMLSLIRTKDGELSPFGRDLVKACHQHNIDAEAALRIFSITEIEYNTGLPS